MYPRIRNLREDNDLNQTEIAKVLNVSQTTYSRYESGILDVPISALIKLAIFYETSIDYIVGLINKISRQG